jgi:hypothetical protein
VEGFALVPKERGTKVTDRKHNHVFLTTHKGKPVLDISWPDYLRNRIRVPDDERKANEFRLTIELSIANGSWPTVRETILAKETPELITGSFSTVADDYYKSWVEVHNRSANSNAKTPAAGFCNGSLGKGA